MLIQQALQTAFTAGNDADLRSSVSVAALKQGNIRWNGPCTTKFKPAGEPDETY